MIHRWKNLAVSKQVDGQKQVMLAFRYEDCPDPKPEFSKDVLETATVFVGGKKNEGGYFINADLNGKRRKKCFLLPLEAIKSPTKENITESKFLF